MVGHQVTARPQSSPTLPVFRHSGSRRAHSGCMSHLTTEEAMSDAAAFLTHLRGGLETRLPAVGAVVGFGGSYGGMLAAWFRLQVSLSIAMHWCSRLVRTARRLTGACCIVSAPRRRRGERQRPDLVVP